jgi:signal peptidase II
VTRTKAAWPVWTVVAAAVVFAVDRLTKFWVSRSLLPGQELWPKQPVHVHLVENSGAAFSILPDQDWLFVPVAFLVVAAVLFFWTRLAQEYLWLQLATGMVAGGAVANAIDRITQGYVVDFIQLPYFAVFNVADMGITVGMVLVVLRFLLDGHGPDGHGDG